MRLARAPHRLAAVSLAALVLVAWDPSNAVSIGFQLSLAAVLGIVTLGLDLVHLRQRLLPLMPWPLDRPSWRGLLWCARSALDGLAIGVAASLATTPLIAAHFLSANPWSPLATLVTAPQTTGALWLGLPCLTLAGFFPSGPWEGLYAGLEACLDALAAAVSWTASWPGATIRVEAPGAATLLLWPALFLPLRDARDLLLRVGAVGCLLVLW
jgi:predicted membrane metal-binding protein